ncbi:MAG: bifunctional hydroxymethylpyrimidine kinase/phosphomethylpyrimidine kinase [Acetobacteraceae bacterium]|nr:bifunctional hydroxymethylpyrimidine kinase/phosphomethylpyrimidine kinase [Acetobacteraceae bacterium]
MRGRVLVIAGSDSGGGAGIQADIKAIMAMGGYSASAVTAITAQNTLGVHLVHSVPPDVVQAQIEAVLHDIGADAIKVGMLGDTATVLRVADCLVRLAAGIPIVVDPVMVAKGGQSLLAIEALQALREGLLPIATLITPNLPEAQCLLGRPIVKAADAARELLRTGTKAVLLKGGHGEGTELTDVLADSDGLQSFTMPRIETRHTHGTGCTLASAIAAGLAQGMTLHASIGRARRYVQEAISGAPGFGAGHGPLNHNVGTSYDG